LNPEILCIYYLDGGGDFFELIYGFLQNELSNFLRLFYKIGGKMKEKSFLILSIIFLLIAAISCGPSPEAVATMTASAWTPTPLPTQTPTPIPYGLMVNVKDGGGNPISLANVVLAEVGEDVHPVDDQGSVAFQNLSGENVSLSVQSPGYLPVESSKTIERGENTIEIALEVDPNGLLPVNACVAGEKLIMVEDMQDQLMQGWGDLTARLESGAPGVDIIEDNNQAGNWILKAYNTTEPGHIQIGRYDENLEDAVVRFSTRNNGGQHLHVGWHSIDSSRYIAFIYADQKGGRVDKFEDPTNFTAFSFGGSIGDGEWHTIEISTFNDVYEIWIDGVQLGSWQDQKPLTSGYFFLGADFWQPDRITEFDNISICGLSAPFTSILAE